MPNSEYANKLERSHGQEAWHIWRCAALVALIIVAAKPAEAQTEAIKPVSVGDAIPLKNLKLNLKPLTSSETQWFYRLHIEEQEEADTIPFGERMMSSRPDKSGVIVLASVTFDPEEKTIKRVTTVCQAKGVLPLVGCRVEWAVEDEPLTATHELVVNDRYAIYRDFLDENAPKEGKRMNWSGNTVMMSTLVRLICLLPREPGKVYHVGRVMMSRMEKDTLQFFVRCEGKHETTPKTNLNRFTLWRGPELFQEYFVSDKGELQRATSAWNEGERLVMQRVSSRDAAAMQLALKNAKDKRQPAKKPAAPDQRRPTVRDDVTAENEVEDSEHKIVLTKHSKGLELLVTDKKGKVLFTGLFNTDAERANVPTIIRNKIKEYGLEDF